MDRKLVILLVLTVSLCAAVSCAGWKELNTREEAVTENAYDAATTDSAIVANLLIDTESNLDFDTDITDHSGDIETSVATVYVPDIGLKERYLQHLLNLISDYESTKANRELRGVEILKIGEQKYLHDEIVSEIGWLNIKINNTKRHYNAASSVIEDSVLDALDFPKYFELKK